MASQAMIDEAKSFLKKESPDTKRNVYDHFCSILHSVLEGRTQNAVDIFEDLSADKKEEAEGTTREIDEREVFVAKLQSSLFLKTNIEDADADPDPEPEMPLPDLMDISYNFEQAGVGLGREETFKIFLALKNLVDTHTLQNVRFWGKIFGTVKNYIVAEVEYREGDEEEEAEEEEAEEKVQEEEEEEEKSEEEDLPKADYKLPPTIPREENGTGCNKKTYFVCNEPGTEWIKLPPVDPAEIVCARQIKKFFTGDLNAPVISYPPFPGLEMNYLRAQIARVSAATHISIIDFYK